MIARRALLAGMPAAGAALALPAIAAAPAIMAWELKAAPATEHPNDKVRRLAKEISEALGDPAFLGFRQVTVTPSMAMWQDVEEDMPADERVHLNFRRLAEAMNELTVDDHGWFLRAGERNTGNVVKHYDGRWMTGGAITLRRELDTRLRGGEICIDDHRRMHEIGDGVRTATCRPVPAIPTVKAKRA